MEKINRPEGEAFAEQHGSYLRTGEPTDRSKMRNAKLKDFLTQSAAGPMALSDMELTEEDNLLIRTE